MTLGTHAVAGAFIGAVASNNLALAASAAFLSHFILDTIPHWDYSLGSLEKKGVVVDNDMNTDSSMFTLDLLKIGFDFLIGMVLVAVAFHTFPPHVIVAAFVGALLGVLPDPLQFVYWKMRFTWMKPLQKFHMWMHAKTDLKERPLLGIFSQVAIIAIILLATRLL